MKNHPTKKGRGRKESDRPLLPTFGELLRVDFLERLGVTPEQISAAIPPDPHDPCKSWIEKIRDLLGQETDESLSVDVSLVLDRVFGFPDGSFLPLWATCAAHSRAKKRRAWLAKVQPLAKERRLATWPKKLRRSTAELRVQGSTRKDKIAGDRGSECLNDGQRFRRKALLRGVPETQALLDAEGGHLSTQEVARKLCMAPSTIHQWRRVRKLFAWKNEAGAFRFPAWQIYRHAILPGLSDVLTELSRVQMTPIAILDYFLSESGELTSRPLDALRNGASARVVAHAKRYGIA